VSISVSYHTDVTKLHEIGARVPIAGVSGPFDDLDWFELLAHHDHNARFLVAEDGENAVMLALSSNAGAANALTNWFSFTWRPLFHGMAETEKAIVDSLLLAAARALRETHHRVTLSPVPDEHGEATRLIKAFRDAGWMTHSDPCDENHVLHLEGRSFAEYWATRPGRMRTTLKRKAKKVEAEILTAFDPEAWAHYQAIYEQSWKPEEEQSALLEAFARQQSAKGHLRMGIANHDGKPVAAQFWTAQNGIAYIHKLAHIEEAKPLSAGTVLSAALFEHVIDIDGADLVDFGTGSDAYKRDWMEVNRPRHRIDCLNLSKPKAWPIAARQGLRRLASGSQQG
jgi:CelD/BcsL family acetyltransferase involved in cellulose biosynthesis